MPDQTTHTRSPSLNCFSSDTASGYATRGFRVSVELPGSIDTSSADHSYVSPLFEVWAALIAGEPSVSTASAAMICVHMAILLTPGQGVDYLSTCRPRD